MLHICPLSQLTSTAEAVNARFVLSLVSHNTPIERPPSVLVENHKILHFNDIVAPSDNLVVPASWHARELLNFVMNWSGSAPMVIHCLAGVSRSTAAAFVTLCALRPNRAESKIAEQLRAASPSATPNRLLVALADDILERDGRMNTAIAAIGRGEDTMEGEPFALSLD